MSRAESSNIINNGQELLNISFEPLMTADIIEYAVGMPSICHQIALNVCLVQKINETRSSETSIASWSLQLAVDLWVDELSDTIRASFALANKQSGRAKFENRKLILTALAAGPIGGMLFDEILVEIHLREPSYPKSNLRNYLRELTEDANGGLVRFGMDSRYRFAEPVVLFAAKSYFH